MTLHRSRLASRTRMIGRQFEQQGGAGQLLFPIGNAESQLCLRVRQRALFRALRRGLLRFGQRQSQFACQDLDTGGLEDLFMGAGNHHHFHAPQRQCAPAVIVDRMSTKGGDPGCGRDERVRTTVADQRRREPGCGPPKRRAPREKRRRDRPGRRRRSGPKRRREQPSGARPGE